MSKISISNLQARSLEVAQILSTYIDELRLENEFLKEQLKACGKLYTHEYLMKMKNADNFCHY
jgi:hypothetical protein